MFEDNLNMIYFEKAWLSAIILNTYMVYLLEYQKKFNQIL